MYIMIAKVAKVAATAVVYQMNPVAGFLISFFILGNPLIP